eukprot:3276972-Pyramimonas_sp.AAC.1
MSSQAIHEHDNWEHVLRNMSFRKCMGDLQVVKQSNILGTYGMIKKQLASTYATNWYTRVVDHRPSLAALCDDSREGTATPLLIADHSDAPVPVVADGPAAIVPSGAADSCTDVLACQWEREGAT